MKYPMGDGSLKDGVELQQHLEAAGYVGSIYLIFLRNEILIYSFFDSVM